MPKDPKDIYHYVHHGANELGELQIMRDEELHAAVEVFKLQERTEDLSSTDPDYTFLVALLREVLRRELTKTGVRSVGAIVHLADTPVRSQAFFELRRRLTGNRVVVSRYKAGYMEDGTISAQEITLADSTDAR